MTNGYDHPIANYFQAAAEYSTVWMPAVEKLEAGTLSNAEAERASKAFDEYCRAVEFLRVRARMQKVVRWEEVWEDEEIDH